MTGRMAFGAAGVAAAGIAAALALAPALPASAQDGGAAGNQARVERAGEQLGARIQAALREGGPWFTAEERATIERACGYAAGSWDGFDVNFSDGGLRCTDGRRVDTPEVRAVMRTAQPRIERRVREAMARPDIQGEIDRVARQAAAAATAAIDSAAIAREALAQAEEGIERARRHADGATREALEDARGEIERARREADAAGEEARRARRR